MTDAGLKTGGVSALPPELAIGSARIRWVRREVKTLGERRMLTISASTARPRGRVHESVILSEYQVKALRKWLEENP